ncbi:MAG: GYF domain-containing protein [Phycisphaerales bacterium]
MPDAQSSTQYLVRFEDGTEIGPLDKQAIRAMAKSGRLKPDDAISHEGTGKWVKAAEVNGLLSNGQFSIGGPSGQSKTLTQSSAFSSRKEKSNSQPDAGGTSKTLIIGLIALAAVVVITTVVWFTISQRRRAAAFAAAQRQREVQAAEQEQRRVASEEVTKAIETAKAIPDSTPLQEDISGIEKSMAIVDRNRSLVSQELLNQAEPIRSRMMAATARRDWLRAAEALLEEIRAARVERQESLPATGLFATNPDEAKRLVKAFLAQDEKRIPGLWWGIRDDLMDGKTDSLRSLALAYQSSGQLSYAEQKRIAAFVEHLGHGPIQRPLKDSEIVQRCKEAERSFSERSKQLIDRSKGVAEAKETDEATRFLADAIRFCLTDRGV